MVDHVITLLSGRGEPAAQICEEIVQTSGLSYTIVRASWFNQNFSEGLFGEFIKMGTLALPVGEVTEPFIDVDDICDVVVASLIDDIHNGQVYEVTGPELLSFSQLAEIFSQVLERAVLFKQITPPEFVKSLQSNHVEPDAIAMLSYLFTEVLDGRNAFLADGVQRALGRSPKSFHAFVTANQSEFE